MGGGFADLPVCGAHKVKLKHSASTVTQSIIARSASSAHHRAASPKAPESALSGPAADKMEDLESGKGSVDGEPTGMIVPEGFPKDPPDPAPVPASHANAQPKAVSSGPQQLGQLASKDTLNGCAPAVVKLDPHGGAVIMKR